MDKAGDLEAAQYNALTAFPSPWAEYGKQYVLCNDLRRRVGPIRGLHQASNTAIRFRDCKNVRRFQAGAADQRAIDVGDRHQFGRVGRFDRSAIEDPNPGPLAAKARDQKLPDKPMNLLDIIGQSGGGLRAGLGDRHRPDPDC